MGYLHIEAGLQGDDACRTVLSPVSEPSSLSKTCQFTEITELRSSWKEVPHLHWNC
jgi:hypothetical protein